MRYKELVSGLGILIALLGIIMSLCVTTPFLRHGTINGGSVGDRFSLKKERFQLMIAQAGNFFLVIGTLAQGVSLFLK